MLTEGNDKELNVSNGSDDEERVPCINCGKLYGEELIKYRPHWVSCDICSVWT